MNLWGLGFLLSTPLCYLCYVFSSLLIRGFGYVFVSEYDSCHLIGLD